MILHKKMIPAFIMLLLASQIHCMENNTSPSPKQQIEDYINLIEHKIYPALLEDNLCIAIKGLENKHPRTSDEQELLVIATYYLQQFTPANKQLKLINAPQKALTQQQMIYFTRLQFLISKLDNGIGNGIQQKDLVRAKTALVLHLHSSQIPENVKKLIAEANYYINAFDAYALITKGCPQ